MKNTHKKNMASQGKLWQESTSSPHYQTTLRYFRQLCESCYGPKGGIKMLISGGGILTVTSTSSILIQNIPFNHPIINMIINFIKSHCCIYNDSGLYIGIICSYIIEKIWTYNGKPTIKKTLQYVCDRCIKLLQSGSIEVKFSSVSDLLNYTESVIASKPGCGLSKDDVCHISVQLVKGFLMSVGDNAETAGLGRVVIVQQVGTSAQDSRLVNGLLYPYPEEEQLTLQLCHNSVGPWKLLLYTCMLTSLPNDGKEVDSISVSSSLQYFNPMISHFTSLMPSLLQAGIKLVACQKVMNTEIRVIFRRAGIVVLHRLGTELAQGLQRISGASAIDTPTASWQQCVGNIDVVKPLYHHEKLYLQLCREEADVVTLLLCSPLPHAANEIEMVVQQALSGLQQLMVQPRLTPGAGCFESWLATKLRNEIMGTGPHIGHNDGDMQTAISWVEGALLRIPQLVTGCKSWELERDSVTYHAWQVGAPECLCGSINRDHISTSTWTELPVPIHTSNILCEEMVLIKPKIVECFRVKASALRHAFDACQVISAVDTIIHV